MVRDHVRQLRDVGARQKRLENLLLGAYRALPQADQLDSIPGIGAVSAAVLTAFILDIDRFATPGKLVAYFGVLHIEVSSGVDRDGQARSPRRWIMSRRGNDLVRRYLWMAALSAIRCNPVVRALYAGGGQASAAQDHRRRSCHAQAVASGVRHLEEWPAFRPQPISLANTGSCRSE
jgi:transposase